MPPDRAMRLSQANASLASLQRQRISQLASLLHTVNSLLQENDEKKAQIQLQEFIVELSADGTNNQLLQELKKGIQLMQDDYFKGLQIIQSAVNNIFVSGELVQGSKASQCHDSEQSVQHNLPLYDNNAIEGLYQQMGPLEVQSKVDFVYQRQQHPYDKTIAIHERLQDCLAPQHVVQTQSQPVRAGANCSNGLPYSQQDLRGSMENLDDLNNQSIGANLRQGGDANDIHTKWDNINQHYESQTQPSSSQPLESISFGQETIASQQDKQTKSPSDDANGNNRPTNEQSQKHGSISARGTNIENQSHSQTPMKDRSGTHEYTRQKIVYDEQLHNRKQRTGARSTQGPKPGSRLRQKEQSIAILHQPNEPQARKQARGAKQGRKRMSADKQIANSQQPAPLEKKSRTRVRVADHKAQLPQQTKCAPQACAKFAKRQPYAGWQDLQQPKQPKKRSAECVGEVSQPILTADADQLEDRDDMVSESLAATAADPSLNCINYATSEVQVATTTKQRVGEVHHAQQTSTCNERKNSSQQGRPNGAGGQLAQWYRSMMQQDDRADYAIEKQGKEPSKLAEVTCNAKSPGKVGPLRQQTNLTKRMHIGMHAQIASQPAERVQKHLNHQMDPLMRQKRGRKSNAEKAAMAAAQREEVKLQQQQEALAQACRELEQVQAQQMRHKGTYKKMHNLNKNRLDSPTRDEGQDASLGNAEALQRGSVKRLKIDASNEYQNQCKLPFKHLQLSANERLSMDQNQSHHWDIQQISPFKRRKSYSKLDKHDSIWSNLLNQLMARDLKYSPQRDYLREVRCLLEVAIDAVAISTAYRDTYVHDRLVEVFSDIKQLDLKDLIKEIQLMRDICTPEFAYCKRCKKKRLLIVPIDYLPESVGIDFTCGHKCFTHSHRTCRDRPDQPCDFMVSPELDCLMRDLFCKQRSRPAHLQEQQHTLTHTYGRGGPPNPPMGGNKEHKEQVQGDAYAQSPPASEGAALLQQLPPQMNAHSNPLRAGAPQQQDTEEQQVARACQLHVHHGPGSLNTNDASSAQRSSPCCPTHRDVLDSGAGTYPQQVEVGLQVPQPATAMRLGQHAHALAPREEPPPALKLALVGDGIKYFSEKSGLGDQHSCHPASCKQRKLEVQGGEEQVFGGSSKRVGWAGSSGLAINQPPPHKCGGGWARGCCHETQPQAQQAAYNTIRCSTQHMHNPDNGQLFQNVHQNERLLFRGCEKPVSQASFVTGICPTDNDFAPASQQIEAQGDDRLHCMCHTNDLCASQQQGRGIILDANTGVTCMHSMQQTTLHAPNANGDAPQHHCQICNSLTSNEGHQHVCAGYAETPSGTGLASIQVAEARERPRHHSSYQCNLQRQYYAGSECTEKVAMQKEKEDPRHNQAHQYEALHPVEELTGDCPPGDPQQVLPDYVRQHCCEEDWQLSEEFIDEALEAIESDNKCNPVAQALLPLQIEGMESGGIVASMQQATGKTQAGVQPPKGKKSGTHFNIQQTAEMIQSGGCALANLTQGQLNNCSNVCMDMDKSQAQHYYANLQHCGSENAGLDYNYRRDQYSMEAEEEDAPMQQHSDSTPQFDDYVHSVPHLLQQLNEHLDDHHVPLIAQRSLPNSTITLHQLMLIAEQPYLFPHIPDEQLQSTWLEIQVSEEGACTIKCLRGVCSEQRAGVDGEGAAGAVGCHAEQDYEAEDDGQESSNKGSQELDELDQAPINQGCDADDCLQGRAANLGMPRGCITKGLTDLDRRQVAALAVGQLSGKLGAAKDDLALLPQSKEHAKVVFYSPQVINELSMVPECDELASLLHAPFLPGLLPERKLAQQGGPIIGQLEPVGARMCGVEHQLEQPHAAAALYSQDQHSQCGNDLQPLSIEQDPFGQAQTAAPVVSHPLAGVQLGEHDELTGTDPSLARLLGSNKGQEPHKCKGVSHQVYALQEGNGAYLLTQQGIAEDEQSQQPQLSMPPLSDIGLEAQGTGNQQIVHQLGDQSNSYQLVNNDLQRNDSQQANQADAVMDGQPANALAQQVNRQSLSNAIDAKQLLDVAPDWPTRSAAKMEAGQGLQRTLPDRQESLSNDIIILNSPAQPPALNAQADAVQQCDGASRQQAALQQQAAHASSSQDHSLQPPATEAQKPKDAAEAATSAANAITNNLHPNGGHHREYVMLPVNHSSREPSNKGVPILLAQKRADLIVPDMSVLGRNASTSCNQETNSQGLKFDKQPSAPYNKPTQLSKMRMPLTSSPSVPALRSERARLRAAKKQVEVQGLASTVQLPVVQSGAGELQQAKSAAASQPSAGWSNLHAASKQLQGMDSHGSMQSIDLYGILQVQQKWQSAAEQMGVQAHNAHAPNPAQAGVEAAAAYKQAIAQECAGVQPRATCAQATSMDCQPGTGQQQGPNQTPQAGDSVTPPPGASAKEIDAPADKDGGTVGDSAKQPNVENPSLQAQAQQIQDNADVAQQASAMPQEGLTALVHEELNPSVESVLNSIKPAEKNAGEGALQQCTVEKRSPAATPHMCPPTSDAQAASQTFTLSTRQDLTIRAPHFDVAVICDMLLSQQGIDKADVDAQKYHALQKQLRLAGSPGLPKQLTLMYWRQVRTMLQHIEVEIKNEKANTARACKGKQSSQSILLTGPPPQYVCRNKRNRLTKFAREETLREQVMQNLHSSCGFGVNSNVRYSQLQATKQLSSSSTWLVIRDGKYMPIVQEKGKHIPVYQQSRDHELRNAWPATAQHLASQGEASTQGMGGQCGHTYPSPLNTEKQASGSAKLVNLKPAASSRKGWGVLVEVQQAQGRITCNTFTSGTRGGTSQQPPAPPLPAPQTQQCLQRAATESNPMQDGAAVRSAAQQGMMQSEGAASKPASKQGAVLSANTAVAKQGPPEHTATAEEHHTQKSPSQEAEGAPSVVQMKTRFCVVPGKGEAQVGHGGSAQWSLTKEVPQPAAALNIQPSLGLRVEESHEQFQQELALHLTDEGGRAPLKFRNTYSSSTRKECQPTGATPSAQHAKAATSTQEKLAATIEKPNSDNSTPIRGSVGSVEGRHSPSAKAHKEGLHVQNHADQESALAQLVSNSPRLTDKQHVESTVANSPVQQRRLPTTQTETPPSQRACRGKSFALKQLRQEMKQRSRQRHSGSNALQPSSSAEHRDTHQQAEGPSQLPQQPAPHGCARTAQSDPEHHHPPPPKSKFDLHDTQAQGAKPRPDAAQQRGGRAAKPGGKLRKRGQGRRGMRLADQKRKSLAEVSGQVARGSRQVVRSGSQRQGQNRGASDPQQGEVEIEAPPDFVTESLECTPPCGGSLRDATVLECADYASIDAPTDDKVGSTTLELKASACSGKVAASAGSRGSKLAKVGMTSRLQGSHHETCTEEQPQVGALDQFQIMIVSDQQDAQLPRRGKSAPKRATSQDGPIETLASTLCRGFNLQVVAGVVSTSTKTQRAAAVQADLTSSQTLLHAQQEHAGVTQLPVHSGLLDKRQLDDKQ